MQITSLGRVPVHLTLYSKNFVVQSLLSLFKLEAQNKVTLMYSSQTRDDSLLVYWQ